MDPQQPGVSAPLDLELVDPSATDDDDLAPISLVYDDADIGVVDEPLAAQPEDLDVTDPDSDASLDVPEPTDDAAARHASHHDFEVTP